MYVNSMSGFSIGPTDTATGNIRRHSVKAIATSGVSFLAELVDTLSIEDVSTSPT